MIFLEKLNIFQNIWIELICFGEELQNNMQRCNLTQILLIELFIL